MCRASGFGVASVPHPPANAVGIGYSPIEDGAMMSFLDEISWRGLLHQKTSPAIEGYLAGGSRAGYAGFDPTSDSLTIGNFIPIKLLMHWQRAGHRPIALMGGGTGMIGDPSGKDGERTLMTRDEVEANVASQQRILERLLDFSPGLSNRASIVNNMDWLEKLGFIEVLRDVGKHFSVNEMIQRDSVKTRLETREQGISYTEFSYMLMQAYDFLHLRRTADCRMQMAGSDQYGNIVAGIDLIRREFGHDAGQAYGVTAPLVTRSDGKKMGKSSGGAVWLSADTRHRTSPYAFYQYWINLPDSDAIPWLRWYTLLPKDEIEHAAARHASAPHERIAQELLAKSMTRMIHGETELAKVDAATRALFSGNVRELDQEMIKEVFADVPHSVHARQDLEGEGVLLADLLPLTSLCQSKREAREHLAAGAVVVNGEKAPADRRLRLADLLHGGTVLLRRGKKNWHATKWE
jgi:tyrosyl-tRNA synthetase